MPTFRFSISEFWILPLLAIFFAACLAQAPVPEPVTDQETELGKAAYNQLLAKAEIIKASPLYDSLRPVAESIARVAQPQYPHPFKFFLVHEAHPNAFATPGGNVYVVDSLLYFVKNTEQLAGTLCHEVSHTIHRDGVAMMEKEKKIEEREVAAAILLGPTRANIIAIALIGRLHSLGYSRDAESKADVTGSDICAQAGYNPWGLTWLFQDFQMADVHQIPQLLSDHPADGTRIQTLKKHFQDNPSTFSKFSPDPKSATPFNVPQDAPVVFLRAKGFEN
ncbi:MAG TPA: M48 family metalloprotease [Terriglobales bacterium]|nr:M48 family metalloprotease [Terriglobales bacterium]